MISPEEIARIKADNSAEAVGVRHGLEFNRQGFAHCSFHADRNPSFHIRNEETFYCFGCGWSGDVIDFTIKMAGLDFLEACHMLGAQEEAKPISDEERHKRRQEARERRRQREAEEEAERAERRKGWPEMNPEDDIMLRSLAELRGLSFTAIKLASLSGALSFCRWKGHICWAIGNSARTCAQIRRMDGEPIEIGDTSTKALTLPGSKLSPIGLTRHPLPVIMLFINQLRIVYGNSSNDRRVLSSLLSRSGSATCPRYL